MGRLGKLILKDEKIAKFYGHFHPDVIGLFDYILDELDDTEFVMVIRNTVVEVTYNTVNDCYFSTVENKMSNMPDHYICRAKVSAYSMTDDDRYGGSGTRIELWLMNGCEINFALPSSVFVNHSGFMRLSKIFLYSQLYLMAYSMDSYDIEDYQRVYTKGYDIFLERLDYDLHHGLDRKPLETYILINRSNISEILDCCNKHDWNELTMEILRIAEEAGIREGEKEQKFRL